MIRHALFATAFVSLTSCSANDAAPAAVVSCAVEAAYTVPCPFPTTSKGFSSEDSAALCETGRLAMNEDLDSFGLPDALGAITGKMQRGVSNYVVGKVYEGERVSLWVQNASGTWEQSGSAATTDAAGAYSFAVPAALQAKGDGGPVYALLEGDGTCAVHGVYAWPRGTKVVVTDIDGTLTKSNDEFAKQVTDPSYAPKEHPSASEAMKAWRRKGYRVVFLSARTDNFRTPTRTWLRAKGIDFGPVITSKTIASGPAAVTYKTASLRKLVDDYGWQIVAAYGNEASDVQAYANVNVPKAQTFTVENANATESTVGLPGDDYAPHITAYIEKQPDAQQP